MTLRMFVASVVVGVIAGGVAGLVMKNGGYGLTRDMALALGGSILAPWVFQAVAGFAEGVIVPILLVALIGAAGLVVAQRELWHA